MDDKLLRCLFNRINKYYFNNSIYVDEIYFSDYLHSSGPDIWADMLFSEHLCRIRISNYLKVIAPQYVLKYLIYHECLHFWLGINHTKKFHNMEKQYPDYQKACSWLESHNHLLEKKSFFYKNTKWINRKIKEGWTLKQIAEFCNCSVQTIRKYKDV